MNLNIAHVDAEFVRKVLRLALPVSLQFLLFSSRNIVDVFMIGQTGEDELAAAGSAASIYMVANHLIWGIAAGIGILGAQYFGAGNPRGIQKSIAIGLVSGLVITTPVIAAFLLFPEHIISVVTDKPAQVALGAQYLQITAFTLMTGGVSVAFQAGLSSMGKPAWNILFTFCGMITNVFLNWVLIFGNLGAPAMGLAGAAIATMISASFEMLVVLVFIHGQSHMLAVTREILKEALSRFEIVRFFKLALPLTAGGLIWSFGALMYRRVYGHMDGSELAVMTILESLMSLTFAFFWGISQAAGIITGHHLGASEMTQAWNRARALIVAGFFMSIIASVLLWVCRDLVFSAFGALDAQTLSLAENVLGVVLLTIWIRAINVVGIVGVLQSGGDNRFVMFMDAGCQWFVGIPLSFAAAFYFDLSLVWVFLAATSEEIAKLFLWIPRLYSRRWMRNLVKGDGGGGIVG